MIIQVMAETGLLVVSVEKPGMLLQTVAGSDAKEIENTLNDRPGFKSS